VKKIYINGKFLCQRTTGTQRYARELLTQIDELLTAKENRGLSLEILVPKCVKSVPRYTNLQVRAVGNMSGTAWEQIDLPLHCRGEILVTLSGGAPLMHPRNMITIHDAAVFAAPEGYSLAFRLWYRSLYRDMARKAERIITVSNFSKSEIVKWCGADPEKISVTYLGSEHFSNLEADASALARFGIAGDYVLAASSDNPNKNLARVIQAMSHVTALDLPLIVAGGQDRQVFRKNTTLPGTVQALGYVSDQELKALYQNAACFVFASLYEGFGLPPLEALSSGCPIVVSCTTSLQEIFAGQAFFCDPYHAEDIAAAIERAVKSPPALKQNLINFAEKFSWQKCARQTLEILSRS